MGRRRSGRRLLRCGRQAMEDAALVRLPGFAATLAQAAQPTEIPGAAVRARRSRADQARQVVHEAGSNSCNGLQFS